MKKQVLRTSVGYMAVAALAFPLFACSSKKAEHTPAPAPRPVATPAPAPAPAPAPVVNKRQQPNVPAGFTYAELAYPTGQDSSSVLLLSKMGPALLNAGQATEYMITATNISDFELRGVAVIEETAGAFRITDSSVRGTQTQTVDGKAALRFELGTLPPGESKTITVKGNAENTGSFTLCATAEYTAFVCYTADVVQPALSLTKTGPNQIFLCDPLSYTVTVTNTGTGVAKGVTITDALPAGVSTTDGQTNVSIPVGDLAAGESRSFQINGGASRAGSFTNNAEATAEGIEVSSNPVTTVVVQPILGVDKTTTGPRDFVGAAVVSTIEVSNTGTGDARNTIVTDTIPAGLQFIRASDGGTVSGNLITWNLGTLAPNANRSLTATFTATAKGVQMNTATVTAECAEQVSDSAQVEIVGIPALLLEVVDGPDPVKVGDTTTYVITVTNQGTADDNEIEIDATLSQMSIVNITGPTEETVTGNNIKFAPLPSLAPGETARWEIVARAESAGDVRFTVSMNSAELTSSVDETEATRLYNLNEVQP